MILFPLKSLNITIGLYRGCCEKNHAILYRERSCMIKERRGYFSTILYCLQNRKFKCVLLQSLKSIILVSITYYKKCKYILVRFSHRKNGREIILEINNRYKMSLNFDDKGICTELIVNKTREVFSTNHFQKIITENMTIIDIGANIGYYALLESQLASKGHIHAIEPVLGTYNLLKKNIALNNCTNISTYNFAIADVDGYKDMYIYDKCNWSSFTKNPVGTIIDTIQVPIFTLDKFIESYGTQHPHFIRMDVEGFEYEILMGSQKTLQKPGPLIFCIEIHPHLISKEKVTTIIDLMKDNGFTINSIFIDMDLSEFKFINLFNQLQNSLQLPLYGYIGNDFSSLEQRLAHGGAIVFFEKSN